jgi:hypothetical protein
MSAILKTKQKMTLHQKVIHHKLDVYEQEKWMENGLHYQQLQCF